MKKAFLGIVITLLCFSWGFSQSRPIKVSIVQLISRPEEYHGKRVYIRGYLHYRFEDKVLYTSKENSVYMMGDRLWVNTESQSIEEKLRQLDGSFVEIEGVYNKNRQGHSECCWGAIDSVFSVIKLKKWR